MRWRKADHMVRVRALLLQRDWIHAAIDTHGKPLSVHLREWGEYAIAFRCGGAVPPTRVVAHMEGDEARLNAISLLRVPRTHRRAAHIG